MASSETDQKVDRAFRGIWRQRRIGHFLFLPICGPLILIFKWVMRYRIENLEEIRKEFRELTEIPHPPLLVCCNHLTYLDSVVLIYAFGSHMWYFFHFRRLTWNLPAANYKRNPFFRGIGYLAKCVFINREGDRTHKDVVLNLGRRLIEYGEVLTVFPEGRRSLTGRFDDRKLAYGIGKILAPLPTCRVLCVYLRSAKQKGKSKIPPLGSTFKIFTEQVIYTPALSGTRAGALITQDIADKIKGLERKYFGESPVTATPAPAPSPTV